MKRVSGIISAMISILMILTIPMTAFAWEVDPALLALTDAELRELDEKMSEYQLIRLEDGRILMIKQSWTFWSENYIVSDTGRVYTSVKDACAYGSMDWGMTNTYLDLETLMEAVEYQISLEPYYSEVQARNTGAGRLGDDSVPMHLIATLAVLALGGAAFAGYQRRRAGRI